MAGRVHLMKLCVGATSVEDVLDWQARTQHLWPEGRAGHVTRMWPKRAPEILNGGALYWVIKGVILCRQDVVGFEPVQGEDGITRCAIFLGRKLVRTQAAPRRAFQGWRYLRPEDAPRDLDSPRGAEKPLPPELAQAIGELGLR